MILKHSDGREVKTGDIVWHGRQACVFLSYDGRSVEVQTVCDRRLFMRLTPDQLKLRRLYDESN